MKKAIAAIIFVSFLLAGNIIHGQVVPERPIDISPLLIGEQVPDLALTNIAGESIELRSILRTSPSIVIFYRGGWCPYCSVYMAKLQSIEQDVLGMGYQILAVSPDSQENMKASIDKHKLNYQLFSDADMKVAQAFGIAYAVPEASRRRLTDSSGAKIRDNCLFLQFSF
jgi:peroxiredoxin